MTITPESKNTLSVTNESKPSPDTWDSSTYTWNEAEGSWDVPGSVMIGETKNSLTINNESKN